VALLWMKQEGNTRYEVRSAGATRRLYTNGVFHSQYNPKRPISGTLWDLLMLPALFYPEGSIRRVLLLGVGGGAVIRLLHHYLQPDAIVGVELNPVHLQLACDYFEVERPGVELIEGDAIAWVKNYRGLPFDMVIDDLFGDTDGEAERAVKASGSWFTALAKLLTPEGVVVINFGSREELRGSGYFSNQRVAKRFKAAYELTLPLFENAIGAFLGEALQRPALRNSLDALRGAGALYEQGRPKYRLRRLEGTSNNH